HPPDPQRREPSLVRRVQPGHRRGLTRLPLLPPSQPRRRGAPRRLARPAAAGGPQRPPPGPRRDQAPVSPPRAALRFPPRSVPPRRARPAGGGGRPRPRALPMVGRAAIARRPGLPARLGPAPRPPLRTAGPPPQRPVARRVRRHAPTPLPIHPGGAHA